MTEPERQRAVVFDPQPLNAAQRQGRACVACGKRWPRPRISVGLLPAGGSVLACDDCAQRLLASVAEHETC